MLMLVQPASRARRMHARRLPARAGSTAALRGAHCAQPHVRQRGQLLCYAG
jgi:hypothetical protein